MAPVLALLLLAQPEAWAEQLGDPEATVRDEATRRLRELGDAAIPALEAAADSADPERAQRARALLRELDDTRRLRELTAAAGPFTLEVRDPEPVAAILERVAAQAGRAIAYDGPLDAPWSGSIRDASLLATLDRVCRDTGLAYAPATDRIRVMTGQPPSRWRAYAGPFAIDVVDVRRLATRVELTLAVGHERRGDAIGPYVDLVAPEIAVPGGMPEFERFRGGERPFLRILGIPADCRTIESLRGVLRVSAPAEFEQWRFPEWSPGTKAIGDRGGEASVETHFDDEALGDRRLWTFDVLLAPTADSSWYEMEFDLRGADGTVLRDAPGPSYFDARDDVPFPPYGRARFLVPAGSRVQDWELVVRASWRFITADVPFELREIPLP